jgi:hypothetical protein
MKLVRLLALCGPILTMLVLMGGCHKSPPPVVAAEGTVTLDDRPLVNVMVQFMPESSDFGAELNSMGVTDDKGHFTLTCNYNSQPGAVVGKHRVVVGEGPVPAEIRRQQSKVAEFQASLKNRPIPTNYGSFSQTPITLEVTPEQKTYAVKLVRAGH